jgi:hypothetical protein
VDGYSVDVPQPNARRVLDDHDGDYPDDCLPHGVDKCMTGHPSLVVNEKEMVDHGERARKLLQALLAAQASTLIPMQYHCKHSCPHSTVLHTSDCGPFFKRWSRLQIHQT